MSFPSFLSFTVTNACNLRCKMCGQWSEEGYMHEPPRHATPMKLADWRRLVDEAAAHGVSTILIRGGEPFLVPGIIDLVRHISAKGIFTSIDSNGTRLAQVADDLVRIPRVHVTISVDGPEAIHDSVRSVPGCYRQIAGAVQALHEAEKRHGTTISKSITFTISPWSYRGLGVMPDVARSLGIGTLCIVPYYYVPEALGLAYERELRDEFACEAFSWRGFHHETSGIDTVVFARQLADYRAGLGSLDEYPYLPLSLEEYGVWFADPVATVRTDQCYSVESLIDVQPDGSANFCVDFPDYAFGNARDATLERLWNSDAATRFRERRRNKPFSACYRCGAKYIVDPHRNAGS